MLERYCGACEEDYNQKVLSSQGAPPQIDGEHSKLYF